MDLVTFAPRAATPAGFIDFWEQYYFDDQYDDKAYDKCIRGRGNEDDRIIKLFTWKNGRKLSRAKEASIRAHFIDGREFPEDGSNEALIAYLARDTGGVIFRVFWLHCNDPEKFPIFDRRAYDAMTHILGWKDRSVLSELSYEKQAAIYVDHYRPFFKGLCIREPRRLDRALWAFGKFLDTYGEMLRLQA